MRAHYKRSKHRISIAWFRLWLSPAFEDATCGNAPEGIDPETWSRKWTSPESPAETRAAVDMCIEQCPVLAECRVLVSLGETPRSVVQAGHAYGLRVVTYRTKPKQVPSTTTPTTEDEEAC